MSCPACGSAVPGTARFCPSCGIAVDFSAAATLEPEATPRAPGSPGASPRKRDSSPSGKISSSFHSFDGARFIPGTVLEDRYRIVADGRGKVRITDFGLAGVAGSFEAGESELHRAVHVRYKFDHVSQFQIRAHACALL
jgi:hypothetical protein